VEEKRLRLKAEAKYASLFQQGVGTNQEIQPAPSTDVIQPAPSPDASTSRDHCRAAQPVHENASEERTSIRSTSLEVQSTTTLDVFKQNPTQTGPSKPPIPISRQNSFHASGATQSQAVAAAQSSIAKQFDPLGTAIPINQSSISATQSGGTNAKSKTNHFDPLGTPVRDSEARDSDHVQVFNGMPQINPAALNGVPQMPVALNGLPSARYRIGHPTWTNHFDPLGTPRSPMPNANDAFPSIMLNGLPQFPDINSTHISSSNPSEIPFDEIVRMSHSQMQDYD